ncbi:MAG: hypothetical protein NTY50_04095 [Methylobacter sp.]|jgi:hypothetical protein|nr:hypothetical protein [Methylobacter sp.]
MLNYSLPYFAASLLIGLLGINRKMTFWGYFFSSLLLTPVMGLLLLLASDPKPKPNVTAENESNLSNHNS